MRNRRFPNYPDDADYNTNASSYYEDLARKQKLIQLLAEKIWNYDERLNERLKDLENVLQDYLIQWDERIENLDDEVSHIFVTWLNDGTLEQIINNDVLGNKADKSYVDDLNESITKQLAQMALHVPEGSGIDEINTIIQTVYDNGGGNVYFPYDEYIITPTQEKTIVWLDNVNLIGTGKTVIKVSDNNPSFDSMIKGLGGKIQNVQMQGITFDTNAENNASDIGLNNRRLIIHAPLANNIDIQRCRFIYSGMNAILMTGAMYGHKNFFAQRNYFKFTPQGTGFYDNTTLYIGIIGYNVTNNVFEGMFDTNFLKPRAVTCFEGHSSYGIFSDNIVSEFGSGVLLLGADYGTSDVSDKSLVQKIVSNNIFRKMWNGITLWAGNRDVNQFIIDGNIIDINNKDRNRPSQNSYGIAFTHPMGGATMRNLVKDGKVSNNMITFQEDNNWLITETTDESAFYMGGFGIGALGRAEETVSLKNIVIENNTIKNSPRQPFVFANENVVTNQYEDIFIRHNTIINPITQIRTDSEYRVLLLLFGQNKRIVLTENYITDDRLKSVLIKEVFFRGALTNFKEITVMDNDFENIDVGLASDIPSFLRPPNIKVSKPDRNRLRLLSNNDSLNGLTFNLNDGYMLRTSTNANIAMCGKEGTQKELPNPLLGSYEDKVITLTQGIDIPFLSGDYIQVKKQSDNSNIHATVRILGIDRYSNKIFISLSGSGNVTINYSKPAFVGITTTQ